MDLAQIYALTGEHTMALDIIEKHLAGPSNTNWWHMKYHILFNKVLGNNLRFIKMIKEDEERFRRGITIDINSYLPN